MAINERDFYASHGFDFDYKNMLEEYIKGVIKQAKIEVLSELQLEIEEFMGTISPNYDEAAQDISKVIQQKINALTEDKDALNEIKDQKNENVAKEEKSWEVSIEELKESNQQITLL